MPTSEPLVPNELPQGERQNIVAAMKAGGIPLAPTQGQQATPGGPTVPPGLTPQAGAPLTGLDLLAGRRPSDFPFLQAGPSPVKSQAGQPDSILSALAASSQSTFGAAVLERLAARRGR